MNVACSPYIDEAVARRESFQKVGAFPSSRFSRHNPGCPIGLERADDRSIWQYARDHDFVIVTKDADYYDLSLLFGAPPNVIWLQTGNTDRSTVLLKLTANPSAIEAAFANGLACIELYA